MRPPLQLERYFFPKVEVNAAPPGGSETKPPKKTAYNLEITPSTEKIAEDRWHAIIQIRVTPATEVDRQYVVALDVVGFFKVAPELSEPDAKKLVTVTGCSILYSAARELLLVVTSRGPYAPVTLPTISLLQTVQEESDSSKTE